VLSGVDEVAAAPVLFVGVDSRLAGLYINEWY